MLDFKIFSPLNYIAFCLAGYSHAFFTSTRRRNIRSVLKFFHLQLTFFTYLLLRYCNISVCKNKKVVLSFFLTIFLQISLFGFFILL